MSDYRQQFLSEVEAGLTNSHDAAAIADLTDSVTKALANYEISPRCTDVIVQDGFNEKILKRFCACLAVDGKSKRTIYQYRRTAEKLAACVGKRFDEMGPYDIRLFLAEQKEHGCSNRTMENQRANLSAFFNWMELDEVIQKSPCRTVRRIKYTDEVRSPFSEIEIDALRAAATKARDRAMIEMLLSSGLRVSELCQMQVADIDFSTLTVHVKHGKGDKERITYMSNVASKHLKEYLTSRKENGPALFYNSHHCQIQPGGVRDILIRIGKTAGVTNVHPHRFRRTFATGLINRGMAIQDVRRLLGHSNINTTLTYICPDDQQVKMTYSKYIA